MTNPSNETIELVAKAIIDAQYYSHSEEWRAVYFARHTTFCMDSAKAAIAAYQSTHEHGEWLPIESAPQDGTQVLLWDGEYMETGSWYVHRYPDKYIARADGLYEKAPTEYREGYWDCNNCQKPTHYRPLPTPPISKEAL